MDGTRYIVYNLILLPAPHPCARLINYVGAAKVKNGEQFLLLIYLVKSSIILGVYSARPRGCSGSQISLNRTLPSFGGAVLH